MSLIQRAYTSILRIAAGGRGLPWRVDDTTTLRIDPRCRWIRNDAYEREVVDYLRKAIRPGDTCIDVGGHVGFYVMQMALWSAPGGRVTAFEPNPTAREVLEANVTLNGLDARVTVEPMAVGSEEGGTAQLFHGEDTSGLSRLHAPNPHAAQGTSVTVPMITLDRYCADRKISPTWILIDVEGFELDVLRGAQQLLRDPRVHVVVEMHAPLWPEAGDDPAMFQGLMDECGRAIVPITGQRDALGEYGSVALISVSSGTTSGTAGPGSRS